MRQISQRNLRIGTYFALIIPLTYVVGGLALQDRWSPPVLSVDSFSAMVGLIVPLSGSISTLFGGVAIWAWAISKQSIRRGLDDLSDAGIRLRRLADSFLVNQKDVQTSDLAIVGRFVSACLRFQGRLQSFSPDRDPVDDIGVLEQELETYSDARENAERKFDDVMWKPEWITMLGDAEILEIRVHSGLDEITTGIQYRLITAQLFRSVAIGLIATVGFALMAATALLFGDHSGTTNNENEYWLLVPAAYIVLFGAVYVVAKPAIVLRSLWLDEDESDLQPSEIVDVGK